MTEDNPLEQLYVDAEEVDREKLAEALRGIIGIDEDTGEPYFMGEFGKLNNKEKIVAYLLYRKAAVSLNKIDKSAEGQSSREIADETGVNYKTVTGWVSKLDFVEKDDNRGGHYIPGYETDTAIEVIGDE